MVRDLEMPLHFSVSRIQRDHRTAEQIGAGPVTAIVVVRSWRVVGGVDDAALGIEGHRKTPLSGAGSVRRSSNQRPRLLFQSPARARRAYCLSSGTSCR